ncbi:hypothetical protein Pelo_1101 [Pelomyxa schiedti]|nr:hypothetical protein Pelo_1101 [Pelomyxa schiedti]
MRVSGLRDIRGIGARAQILALCCAQVPRCGGTSPARHIPSDTLRDIGRTWVLGHRSSRQICVFEYDSLFLAASISPTLGLSSFSTADPDLVTHTVDPDLIAWGQIPGVFCGFLDRAAGVALVMGDDRAFLWNFCTRSQLTNWKFKKLGRDIPRMMCNSKWVVAMPGRAQHIFIWKVTGGTPETFPQERYVTSMLNSFATEFSEGGDELLTFQEAYGYGGVALIKFQIDRAYNNVPPAMTLIYRSETTLVTPAILETVLSTETFALSWWNYTVPQSCRIYYPGMQGSTTLSRSVKFIVRIDNNHFVLKPTEKELLFYTLPKCNSFADRFFVLRLDEEEPIVFASHGFLNVIQNNTKTWCIYNPTGVLLLTAHVQ